MADTLTRIQVSGTYQDPNRPDFPVEGKIVQFIPNAKRILNAAGATVCVPQTLNVELDSNGSFSVPLIATNDPDGTPIGWTYTVKEPFGTNPYPILVPFDSPGLAVNLVDIAPAASESGGTVQLVGGIGIVGVSLSDDDTALVFDMSDGSSQTSPALPYATTTSVSTKADSSTVTALSGTVTSLSSSVNAKVEKTAIPPNAVENSVDNTGATDCSTNLQAFLNSLAGTEQVARLYGTFKHASTIIFKGNVDASGATFNYTGSGTAVQVGPGGSAVLLNRVKVHLPKIINTTKPGTGWTASTVGVKCVNLNACWVWAPYIQGFETGFLLYGQDIGVSYNHFFIGHLDNNKVNQMLDGTTSGWVNQNNYYGGRYSHNSSEGSNVSGTKHILLTSNMGSTENNNTWYGPSLESPGVAEYVIDAQASNVNVWDQARFEYSGGGSPNVRWGARATANLIRRGNNSSAIVETFVTGAARNDIDTDSWSRHTVSGTKGFVMENNASSANQTIAGLRAGGTILGDDPVTAYAWRGTAAGWGFKRFGDAFDRVFIDATNGQVLVGSGTATPTTALGSATGSTVNVYTTPGTTTWTKPAGCNAVMVLVVNAGAGGGSGRRGAAASVRCGGGGGGGGGYSYRVFPASVLSSTETVTVGAGGAGGVAVTTDDTNGNPGASGGTTLFKSVGVTQMGIPTGGGGGTNAAGTAGASGMVSPGQGGPGGAASTTGGVGVAGTATNVGGATGGGSGGGVTSADAVSAGGGGASLSGLVGGTAGTSAGGAGGAGGGSATDQPGTGGGGGGSSITGAGGTGGAGALVGGGGGGGGASLNGNASGAGGAGANGVVVVVAV